MTKRAFDLVVAAVALVVLAPVLGLTALAVRLQLGRPILYRQRRPGLHGRAFTLYKFRTMRDVRDRTGALLPDAERLTRFGRLLRSTSLDELPELWNVLRGDMSIVGPRPLLMEYLPLYNRVHARRHEVRPGITGLAQVSGRNALPWKAKLDLDVRYVEQRSLGLDLRVLARTVRHVLAPSGISQNGHATMEPFRGLEPRCLVIGGGGHGRVVADLARVLGHRVVGFIDSDPAKVGASVDAAGAHVVLTQDDFFEKVAMDGLSASGADAVLLGVGDNAARHRLWRRLDGLPLPLLAHPAAAISPCAEVGPGSVVLATAVVNAGAKVGRGVIINSGAVVEHDCRLGDGVHVSPRAVLCGGVAVGDRTWIGAAAVVIQQVRIGADCIIGAGAVVIRDVPDGTVVVGNPAHAIRTAARRAGTYTPDLESTLLTREARVPAHRGNGERTGDRE